MAPKKVKVALFLEPAVARDLKVQAAQADSRGLSDYITRLLKSVVKRRTA